jgi:hypothetical protein
MAAQLLSLLIIAPTCVVALALYRDHILLPHNDHVQDGIERHEVSMQKISPVRPRLQVKGEPTTFWGWMWCSEAIVRI